MSGRPIPARTRDATPLPAVKTPVQPSALRPFVLINLAITADGRIATANRRITAFGTPRDRRHVYELRATVDAILCGARTVEESRATLDAGDARFRRQRLRRGLAEHPIRIVASGLASLSARAPVLKPHPAPLVILTTLRAPEARLRRLERRGAILGQFGENELDLPAALDWLVRHWGIQRLLLEGGSQLNASMLSQGLVDELHLTLCPYVFGGLLAPTLADGTLPIPLSRAQSAQWISTRRLGRELYLVYRFPQSQAAHRPELTPSPNRILQRLKPRPAAPSTRAGRKTGSGM